MAADGFRFIGKGLFMRGLWCDGVKESWETGETGAASECGDVGKRGS